MEFPLDFRILYVLLWGCRKIEMRGSSGHGGFLQAADISLLYFSLLQLVVFFYRL